MSARGGRRRDHGSGTRTGDDPLWVRCGARSGLPISMEMPILTLDTTQLSRQTTRRRPGESSPESSGSSQRRSGRQPATGGRDR